MKRFFIVAALGTGLAAAAHAIPPEGPAHNFTPQSLIAAVDAYDQGYLQFKAQGDFEAAAKLDDSVKAEGFTYCSIGKTIFQDAHGETLGVEERTEPQCMPHTPSDPVAMEQNDADTVLDVAKILSATINHDSTAQVEAAFTSNALGEKNGSITRSNCVYEIALSGDTWKMTGQQCVFENTVMQRPAPFDL